MTSPILVKVGPYIYNEAENIGKGSYGKVYKGKNTSTGRTVAIKVILVESNKQSTQIKMIKNEVEALKRTKNDYILQFLDFQVQSNYVYIITEFCNQKDLKYYLSKRKILKEDKAVEFLKQIVLAFKELCSRKVIHRDLKPANIFMHNGVCKIGDFGFAKTLDFSVTDYNNQMVSVVGTPLYMSPQLLDKQKYTTKSDIWSLGIIFYEMLFGRVPWTGKDPATYSRNIRNTPLAFDRNVNDISLEAEDFLQQCLKVNEEERIGWNELFDHPLVNDKIESSTSTNDSSDCDFQSALMAEKMVKEYTKNPINPSNLMKFHEGKTIGDSKAMMTSHVELPKTTLDQKLKLLSQVITNQSSLPLQTKANTQSKTINLSYDEGKNGETVLKSQIKSGYLKDSTTSPEHKDKAKQLTLKTTYRSFEETHEEFKKIEAPLLALKNKLILLNNLFLAIYKPDDFKDLTIQKFNLLIAISKLSNIIFKNLSSQVLTKKVKTRSSMLADYLDSDSFKRILVFVETEKKQYDEILRSCSRRIFDLNVTSDKERDEVLDFYHEAYNETEEQTLLGKIIDVAHHMLSQNKSQLELKHPSLKNLKNQSLNVLDKSSAPKDYLDGLLVLFDETMLDAFKYDKVDEVLNKVQKLKEEMKVK